MKFQRMNSSTSLSNDCDWKRTFRSLVNDHIFQTNQWIKFIKEEKKKDKGKNKKYLSTFSKLYNIYYNFRSEDVIINDNTVKLKRQKKINPHLIQ